MKKAANGHQPADTDHRFLDAGTLQAMSPTMRAHVLEMCETGKIRLFDPETFPTIRPHLRKNDSFISVADTVRLLNGEIPDLQKLHEMFRQMAR